MGQGYPHLRLMARFPFRYFVSLIHHVYMANTHTAAALVRSWKREQVPLFADMEWENFLGKLVITARISSSSFLFFYFLLSVVELFFVID